MQFVFVVSPLCLKELMARWAAKREQNDEQSRRKPKKKHRKGCFSKRGAQAINMERPVGSL